MRLKSLSIAPLAALLLPSGAPAQTPGAYSVRNDTRVSLDCGLRREHGSTVDRFVLRAGEEWRSASTGSRPRLLACATTAPSPRFRLSPGVRYALWEAGANRLQLREIGR